MMNQTVILKSLKETEDFAKALAKNIKKGSVLAFYGDLGSGKTTFINFLANELGTKRRLISPTFVISRSYKNKKLTFNHIDLYRIKSNDEFFYLGLPEIINDKNSITAIEWAEKIEKYLPKNSVRIYLKYLDSTTREIVIK